MKDTRKFLRIGMEENQVINSLRKKCRGQRVDDDGNGEIVSLIKFEAIPTVETSLYCFNQNSSFCRQVNQNCKRFFKSRGIKTFSFNNY